MKKTSIVFQSDFWNKEYKKGYIYGIFPSATALITGQILMEHNLIGKKISILEIGGGYGRNSLYFNKQLGLATTLMDYSNTSLGLAKKLMKTNKNKFSLICGDITKLDQYFNCNQKFDIVFHNFVLHLLGKSERQAVYDGVIKILKLRGIFVGSFLSASDPDYKLTQTQIGIDNLVRGKIQHFFNEQEIRNELPDQLKITSIIEHRDIEVIVKKRRNTHYYHTVATRT